MEPEVKVPVSSTNRRKANIYTSTTSASYQQYSNLCETLLKSYNKKAEPSKKRKSEQEAYTQAILEARRTAVLRKVQQDLGLKEV